VNTKSAPTFFHVLARAGQHVPATVQARVHVRAVAVLRMQQHVVEVAARDVDHGDRNAEVGAGAERFVAQVVLRAFITR
jgi:hypothetical protein